MIFTLTIAYFRVLFYLKMDVIIYYCSCAHSISHFAYYSYLS